MSSTTASIFTPSKFKYLVIIFFMTILGFTVYKMMEFEDSIREKRIVRVNVGGEKKKIIPEISLSELQKKSAEAVIKFRARNKYFSVKETRIKGGENLQEWSQYFLKGVNMGVALPGNYPSEFSATYEIYLDWFRKIAEMNSNTIRVYTILPPVFYEAFAQYNLENNHKPLYILHGVWAGETDSNDYYDNTYVENFQKEIKDVIDVMHGNAVLQERPGHASGVYARDISGYVIGILLGREWEPVTVTTTNKKNKNIRNYNGHFISLPSGTPMETWLARMMDFTVHYETQIYNVQRPVSFVNWLPTDPMYHNSEFIENKKVREYDNDLESIDFKKFYSTNLFKAGIFASYHAYPYYPDYIYLEDKYKNVLNRDGIKDNYYGYLEDLKDHCPDMPLVIAEYGLPSSRGNSHDTPDGLSQGGHSEHQQAEKNKMLTEDIYNTGCGGAIYFEWIDEWFKFNWLVIDFEVPANRRKFWHNMENPEQNFGIVAVEQRTKTVDGSENDWKSEENISQKDKYKFSAGSDAEYYYMKYNLDGFDLSKNNLYIAIDTYDKSKGDHSLPFTKENLDRGAEFLIEFINKDSAAILVDDQYSVYSDIYNDYIPVYASKENSDGKFVRQILLSNRERETLLGVKTDRKVYDRSSLIYGNSSDSKFSNSNWYWNENDKVLEIRIPWHLLNVSDPSSRNVLDDIQGTGDIESSETDGFYIYSFITDKSDNNAVQIPESSPDLYKWEKWEKPEYTSRLKPTYYMFRDLFSELTVTDTINENEVQQSLTVAKWYNNKEGAITLSFDDGTMAQYTYGVPVLDKYNMKATFALVTDWTTDNPSSSAEKGNFSIEKFGWKQANELLANGHEIASHNQFHIKMDTLSESEIMSQMLESRITAEKNLNSKVYTFVFPYSATRQDFFNMTAKAGYLFSRTGEESVNQSDNLNLEKLTTLAIYSENVPDMDQINGYIQEAKGKWLILNYHNIFPYESKEMNLLRYHKVTATYSVTPELYNKQIRLIRNSDYWIAPINVIGRYIKEREDLRLEITNHDNKIFLKAGNDLDTNVYNIPLTIIFTTDWKTVKVVNSAEDGIYNPRNSVILINLYPNREVILEDLTDRNNGEN